MDSKVISKIYFLIIFLSTTHLYALEFQGKFLQGHFIIGVTDPLAKIIDKEIRVSQDGYFVFGIER